MILYINYKFYTLIRVGDTVSINKEYLRILNVMRKAEEGDKIVIGAIGGSITAGARAGKPGNRYVNLVKDWWVKKFPNADIELVNAGIGATNSGYACYRVKEHLLKRNPDFVLIDFAVNEYDMSNCSETMEGLVRQILSYKSKPAIMQIFMMKRRMDNAQEYFIPVCNHYHIPWVSFQDRVREMIQSGKLTIDDVIADEVHPNDEGHALAASIIIEKLEDIYMSLPEFMKTSESLNNTGEVKPGHTTNNIQEDLPAPLISDTFQFTSYYNYDNIQPKCIGNWKKGTYECTAGLGLGTGWCTDKSGDELVFELPACSTVSITYKRYQDNSYGIAEAWIDDGPRVRMDAAYYGVPWPGPYAHFKIIQKGLEKKSHTLHIKVLSEKYSEIAAFPGNYFEVINILVS